MVVAVAKDWPSVFVVSSVWWWFDGEDLEIEMRDEGVVVEKEKRLERLSITDVEEITLGMFFAICFWLMIILDPWSLVGFSSCCCGSGLVTKSVLFCWLFTIKDNWSC